MAPGKKNPISNLTQYDSPIKDPPEEKKAGKRQSLGPLDEDDDMPISTLIDQYQASIKKDVPEKVDPETEAADTRKKILNLFIHQHQARKQYNDNIFKKLSEIISQVETDYNVMKENEQKLEQLTGSFMEYVRQSTVTHKQKLDALNQTNSFYKKQFEKMELEQKKEVEDIVNQLDNDIKKLEDKFNMESKRKSWDCLRRNILHAMQNDY